MEPWNTFPKNYRYRLSPASEVYHKVERKHPLAVTVAMGVVFVSFFLIGGAICAILGWPT